MKIIGGFGSESTRKDSHDSCNAQCSSCCTENTHTQKRRRMFSGGKDAWNLMMTGIFFRFLFSFQGHWVLKEHCTHSWGTGGHSRETQQGFCDTLELRVEEHATRIEICLCFSLDLPVVPVVSQ